MGVSINNLSFLATVLATVFVIGVSLYGAVKCIKSGKFFAGIAVLIMIPIWLVAQVLMIVIYDAMVSQDMATREYHLDYAVTPFLNLAGAALVGYVVVRYVRRLTASPSNDSSRASQSGILDGAASAIFEPRKMVGVLFIGIGAATIASWFFISGVLFVVVGVSLIMDVRIWRN